MIRQASIEDSKIVAELALLLWPDNGIDELEKDIKESFSFNENASFIYYHNNVPVGFAQCGLRRDYVEGTNSSPVGYLEGIFIKPEYRMAGIATQLLEECENWSRVQGCSEFASDCELINDESLKFHLNVGFEEANRIICFTKKL